jgi:nucleoside-triphosphatase THEP1
MAFVKAVKFDSKLRMSIAGPSGSGKTWTSLTLATALANGGNVAVVDTERKSASKYADSFAFDVMELDTYHPQQFIDAIHEAEAAGYAVLVIDSLSHAWNGTGGLLEVVDAIAKRKNTTNTFIAWKDATPIQNALIDAITRSSLHIICTMRAKQEYAVETVNGKATPKKIGMAPIQRDGMEYEFDVAADMDIDNNLIIQKSRCPALSGQVIAKPDSQVADVLKSWLSGVPVAMPTPAEIAAIRNEVGTAFAFKDEEFETRWEKCKATILGHAVADPDLSKADISKIRTYTENAKNRTAGGGR